LYFLKIFPFFTSCPSSAGHGFKIITSSKELTLLSSFFHNISYAYRLPFDWHQLQFIFIWGVINTNGMRLSKQTIFFNIYFSLLSLLRRKGRLMVLSCLCVFPIGTSETVDSTIIGISFVWKLHIMNCMYFILLVLIWTSPSPSSPVLCI
jgi:hypothetical protein